MLTLSIIGARDVLRAISRRQCQRLVRVVAELERLEFDQTQYRLEEGTDILGSLIRTGSASREVRQIYVQVETLCVVLIVSLLDAASASTRKCKRAAIGNAARRRRASSKRPRKE